MNKLFILIPILFFLTVLTGCETDYVGYQVRHVTSYEFGIIKSQGKPEDDSYAQILYTVELFDPFSGQPIHDSILTVEGYENYVHDVMLDEFDKIGLHPNELRIEHYGNAIQRDEPFILEEIIQF